jgi:hypothetical protein
MNQTDVKARLFEIIVKKLINEIDIEECFKDDLLTDYADLIGEIAQKLTIRLFEWGFVSDFDEDLL